MQKHHQILFLLEPTAYFASFAVNKDTYVQEKRIGSTTGAIANCSDVVASLAHLLVAKLKKIRNQI